MSEASQNTNSSSSPSNPKMSPGLAKAIAEGTLKLQEGQPEPTFFHCAVDDCGYRIYGEIAQKYHAKEVHDLVKSKFLEKNEDIIGAIMDTTHRVLTQEVNKVKKYVYNTLDDVGRELQDRNVEHIFLLSKDIKEDIVNKEISTEELL